MKGYCTYVVIDKATGLKLVSGEKWKEYSSLYYNGSFTHGLFRKSTIHEYLHYKRIGGVNCLVVYWIEPTPQKPFVCSVVSPYGRCLGLRGTFYDSFEPFFFKDPDDFRYFLKAIGEWNENA